MTQDTVGQRIKFIIEAQKMSVRKFAQVLDISEANVRNYFDRGTKPSSDFFEKIDTNFPLVNITWLITGKGEPFLQPPTENRQTQIHAQKILRSPVVGTNNGTAYQEQNSNPNTDEKTLQTLALAQQEIENLRTQLAMKDALLAAKDETISLLKGAYRNPN